MPELPEVETVRRSLAPRLVGRTVTKATLHRRDIAVMPGDPEGGFSRQREIHQAPKRVRAADMLQGRRLVEPLRRGKQLAIVSAAGDDGRPAIIVHLGMTGQLRWVAAGGKLDAADHVHATWRLDDGSRLVFRDPRRFGGIWLLPDQRDLEARWATLGPDGLESSINELVQALDRSSRRAVKAALLDQGVIAGIGNIYADESLFRAGVHPLTPLEQLDDSDRLRLARSLRGVLQAAVDARGSTLRDYADADGRLGAAQGMHRVYGRGSQPCTTCGTLLEREVIAQRTTVWCPSCQPTRL
ncbi:MAG: bifunctional DNA-formamidopyrimidine glycosylase/DNA-(apurinic or apyrimidinic site) lyase [Planctomycetota bacterium]